MNIDFKNEKIQQPILFLARPGEKLVCVLNGLDESSVQYTKNLKSFDTLSFTVNQYVYNPETQEKVLSNGYDLLDIRMELFLSGYGWFRINDVPTVSFDGYSETKDIVAESIESELQDDEFGGFKINYGSVDSLEMMVDGNTKTIGEGVLVPLNNIKFYDEENPDLSLLNIVLDGTERWTIGYVDDDLKEKVYRFDLTQTSNRYAFLSNDIANAYECIIVFNILNFTVNAYSLNVENVLNRNLFKDSNLIVGFRGVENSISRGSEQDVYTVYRVSGGEELNINDYNFASSKIENFDYFLNTNYVSTEFIRKYNNWKVYRDTKNDTAMYGGMTPREKYISLMKQYRAALDVASDLQDRVPSSGVQTDWATMTDESILESYSNYTALIAALEALYVDDNGHFREGLIKNSKDWEVYYETKTYTIPTLEYEIARRGLDPGTDLPEIDAETVEWDYDAWETDWTLYGTNELKNKMDAYQGQLDVLKESGFDKDSQGTDGKYTDEYFNEQHQEYLRLRSEYISCRNAYLARTAELNTVNNQIEYIKELVEKIVADVGKSNERFRFTSDDFLIIWKLTNEIDYINENIFITTLDTVESMMDVKKQLYEDGVEQLSIYSQPQYTYTSTLDNLLAMYDYHLFHEDFDVGNYIRIQTNDNHQVKVRLIAISFNPMVMQNDLTIQFSNMLTSKNARTDKVSLLDISSGMQKNAIMGTSTSSSNGDDVTQRLIAAILNNGYFKDYSTNLSNKILNTVAGSVTVSGTITVDELKAKLAQVDTLEAGSAFIQYMEAELISVDKLVAELAQMETAEVEELFANQAYANKVTTLAMTAARAAIDVAYITNIVAGNMSVADLQAGDITLSNAMRILSQNGMLIMNGTTLQIKGTGQYSDCLIQLGYDASGKPSLIIKDENDATIMTADGITQHAIADGLIVNDMIANGTIQKGKLDATFTSNLDTTLGSLTNTQSVVNTVVDSTSNPPQIVQSALQNSFVYPVLRDSQTGEIQYDPVTGEPLLDTNNPTNISEYSAEQAVTSDGIISTVSSHTSSISGINSAVSQAQSDIIQNASNIALRVEKNGVIASINVSPEVVTIDADRLNVTDIFAQNVTATGTITGATLVGASGKFTKDFEVNFSKDYQSNSYNYKLLAKNSEILIKTDMTPSGGTAQELGRLRIGKPNSDYDMPVYLGVGAPYEDHSYLEMETNNAYLFASGILYLHGDNSLSLNPGTNGRVSVDGSMILGNGSSTTTVHILGNDRDIQLRAVYSTDNVGLYDYSGSNWILRSSSGQFQRDGTTYNTGEVTGDVYIPHPLYITGDLHATGSYTGGSNIILGSASTTGGIYTRLVTSARSVELFNLETSGNVGLYDRGNGEWILSSGSTGNVGIPHPLNVGGRLSAPNIVSGTVTITPTAADTPTGKAVTWSNMGGTPNVVATARTTAPGTVVKAVSVYDKSATGCTIYVTRSNTTGTPVDYIAIY